MQEDSKRRNAGFQLLLLFAVALCLHYSRCLASGRAQVWDTRPDTWVAVDELKRTLPTFAQAGPAQAGPAQAGPPRANKFVGIFYFLWLGEHGSAGPFDITRILAADPAAMNKPDSPLWGPLGSPHHWGESVFGYYLADDEWVLRKHAQMLSDAGVDTLIFDVTNQLTYPKSYLALCRVFTQIRREGGRTPQIAFLTPFGDPAQVVKTLYEDFYKPGLYADLWFRWEGKPLIMADPAAIKAESMNRSLRVPGSLDAGKTAAQSFVATRPFTAIGGEFPTYFSKTSGMTLSLHRDGPRGPVLARRRFQNIADNATVLLEIGRTLPPGTYYLEQSQPSGMIGWWGQTGDVYPQGRAFADGLPASGDRTLSIVYSGETRPGVLSPAARVAAPGEAAKKAGEIRNFFTFRKPQPDYFQGPTGPEQWGWLEVAPPHVFYKTPGVPEQMTVGVAQNAVDGKLGVLSNPRAHGRSFHDGQEPPASEQDYTGRNFTEQWQRAFEVDPPFVFVTGWNEWIAGRFDATAPFFGAGPVNFVDTFNHEYSRDIEPVRGGHTDSYYYQLIANIRRFKGVRPLPTAAPPRTLRIDGRFNDWNKMQPEFRDDRNDTAPRNHAGWGQAGTYRNATGRNDFEVLKVARDARFLYFYARTTRPIVAGNIDWMSLFLDTDGSANGWQGFDFAVRRNPFNPTMATLQRSTNGRWQDVSTLKCRVRGHELELAVPRRALGLEAPAKPLQFDFKWTDNVQSEHDALNLYTNGDTAPNGRFRFRYVAGSSD